MRRPLTAIFLSCYNTKDVSRMAHQIIRRFHGVRLSHSAALFAGEGLGNRNTLYRKG